ncbi:MAG: hypothetical protein ABSF64_16720 [Bryobacteraceae bacterium]
MPRANIRAGHTDAAIGILQQRLAKDPAAVAAGILLTETLLLSPKTNPTLAWSVCPATFAFVRAASSTPRKLTEPPSSSMPIRTV